MGVSRIMTVANLKTLLGHVIKSSRAALGISQEELANRAGLHRTYVSDIERGARNPSLESVEKQASKKRNLIMLMITSR